MQAYGSPNFLGVSHHGRYDAMRRSRVVPLSMREAGDVSPTFTHKQIIALGSGVCSDLHLPTMFTIAAAGSLRYETATRCIRF